MTTIIRRLNFLGIVLVCTALSADAPVAKKADLLLIDNGVVRVGIDRSMGASITWLSWQGHPGSVVNVHDPGRLIQQSYYAGRRLDRTSEGQSKNWSSWAWNPIQGGGVSSWARVTRFEKVEEQTLFGETIPKLWDMPNEEAAAVMQQWTSFEQGLVRSVAVRNRVTCRRKRNDRWGEGSVRPQEIPACYFNRTFNRFESYLGNGEWRSEETRVGPPWERATPPRNAMACFDTSGQGIAIFSPTANSHWNYGPHVRADKGGPKDAACVHVAPISRVPLGPQSTYEYRYWLVVGTKSQIAAELDMLLRRFSNEKSMLTHDDHTLE